MSAADDDRPDERPQPIILPTNQAEALAFYARHNLPVTPVRPTEKKGRLPKWSTPGHSAAPAEFRPGENVGVLNATQPRKGWWFHDLDIDANTEIARRIVERLTPPTGWRYGRIGKPRSHANYLTDAPIRSRRYSGADGAVILELRGLTQKKTHTLSVGPGSTHTSGEAIRFVEPVGPIGRVKAGDLDDAVRRAAFAVALAAVWPDRRRHDLRLACAKLLLEHGMVEAAATETLEAVMAVTGSDERDVAPCVSATAEALREGRAATGASVILEILGEAALRALKTILGVPGPIDDGVAVNILELTVPMVDRAWQRVVTANEPPGLFKRDKEVLILRDCTNTCLSALYEQHIKMEEPAPLQGVSGFRKIDVDTFREIVGRMTPCVAATSKGVTPNVFPPKDFATMMLSNVVPPLPEPTGFTPIPFFTLEGTLVTTPGLHRPTGMLYQPLRGFEPPDVPERPTPAQVAQAIGVLDEMVWQFPFKGRLGQHPYLDLREQPESWRQTASYVNMLAFPLTVLTRSLFHAVPLFLIDKPTTRTGASLLVQCWSYVLTGAWPSEAEWDGSESERRKFLTAILITGAPIIFLDEVKDLKSPDLNKILTGKNARIGRVLGSTEITNPRNFSTFVATGNNPAFPKDMAGRMCRVRLDTSTQRPSERSGWDKELTIWVPQNRHRLLQALYVIARSWFVAGKPGPLPGRALNGFEPWSEAIGGMLLNAGLSEFLANKRDVEDDAETEDEDDIEPLLEAWWAGYANQSVSTTLLLKLDGLPRQDGQPWSARQLGHWLRRNRDRSRTLGSGVEVRIVKEKAEHRWKMRAAGATDEGPLVGSSNGDGGIII